MTSIKENVKLSTEKKDLESRGMILCGLCQNEMKKIPNDSIDLTVTSPPYDNIRDYKGYCFEKEDFVNIVKELYRVTKNGGVVVWVVGDSTIKGSESGTSLDSQVLWMVDLNCMIQ